VVKSDSRFDKTAADALLRLAAPKHAGAYLSPRPRTERLYTNLLRVSHYAPDMHIAQTVIREGRELWAKAKELGVEIGPEWFLSDGNLMSFHDLSQYPWNRFCDAGSHETFDTSEWAESDDKNRQRQFVRLLNCSLTERLKEWAVRRRKDDDMYYFAAAKAFRPRRVDFSGSIAEQFRTVVQKFPSGKTNYILHLAFSGYFKKMDGAWYLEITPSYIFTIDGFRPSKPISSQASSSSSTMTPCSCRSTYGPIYLRAKWTSSIGTTHSCASTPTTGLFIIPGPDREHSTRL
jgi:hypothetical protein